MDILHLSDNELDFEIQLRKETTSNVRTRREKTGKLRAILENERITMEIPESADHVLNQAEHVDICQKKLQLVHNRLTKALEEESSAEIAVCRSKLMHYRARVAMITDKDFVVYARKLENYIEESLQKIGDFFNSVTLLTSPIRKTSGDGAILPEMEELAERLRDSRLQSSLKDPAMAANPKTQEQNTAGIGSLLLPPLPKDNAGNRMSTPHDRRSMPFWSSFPIPPPRTTATASRTQAENNNSEDVRDAVIRYLLQSRGDTPRQTTNTGQYRLRSTQPIHKWPFSYAGEAKIMQLAVFLNQVETYANTEDVDELALLRGVKHLLRGRALEWYIRSYNNLQSWEHFKKEIKKEFLPQAYSQHMKRDLYWRIQGPDEPFLKYYRDILALSEVVEPPIADQDRFYIMKSNLNPEFAAIASASRAATVEELISVCKDYDEARTYSQRSRTPQASRLVGTSQAPSIPPRTTRPITSANPWNRPLPARTQHVNLLEENETDIPEHRDDLNRPQEPEEGIDNDQVTLEEGLPELNAIRSSTWQPGHIPQHSTRASHPNMVCWQCEQQGHVFPNCPNSKTFIFCFRCGKKGTTSRSCPDCIARLTQALSAPPTRTGNDHPGFPQ